MYSTRIVRNILFHSVPYTKNGDPGSLEYWEYDKQNDIPYMWAESTAYWYRGVKIATITGGDLYTAPVLQPATDEDGKIILNKENGTEEFDAKNEEATLATMSTRYASNFINDLYIKANIKDDRYLYF